MLQVSRGPAAPIHGFVDCLSVSIDGTDGMRATQRWSGWQLKKHLTGGAVSDYRVNR